ncbi:SAM-dependent methyltransferase [Lederbergia wuyishanensis]|uniref:SAM-dependent methyltransferase n=1 Tax=Lederbergia wuyishanensis TaxID=1347903 RepID=A0ABU0D453_9BACI|nr:methyltransferase [Lederbergia wuyishanensis]MCJ8008219.1 SAM-dependent methyltransferase [Lederbergia wuyishanensis]MDQ0343192.1 SAM-dependent methyltransferase [Lederbergia wuyishanensis]
MNEKYFDAVLNIKTDGEQMGFNSSFHYHRYEPTPYSGLEILFNQYELKNSDRIVDFGCGKGRLLFYIHHLYKSFVTGIEMNEDLYQEAVENKKRYIKKHPFGKDKIDFQCCLAEEYVIHPQDNRFYFFNPFTIQIFMKVVNNILLSVEESAREVELILYYSSENYIYYLENDTSFELKNEIIIPDLYRHNSKEKFLIYTLNL